MEFTYKFYIKSILDIKLSKVSLSLNSERKLALSVLMTKTPSNFRYFMLLKLTNLVFLFINELYSSFRYKDNHVFFLKINRFVVANKYIFSFDKFKFTFKARNFYLQYLKERNIAIFSPAIMTKVRKFRYKYLHQLRVIRFALYYHFLDLKKNIIILSNNYTSKDYLFFNFFIRSLNIYKRVYKDEEKKRVVSLQVKNNIFFGVKKLKKFPRKKRFLIKRFSVDKQYIY
jgi:hypothetical protein